MLHLKMTEHNIRSNVVLGDEISLLSDDDQDNRWIGIINMMSAHLLLWIDYNGDDYNDDDDGLD